MSNVVQVDWNRRVRDELKKLQGDEPAEKLEKIEIYESITDLSILTPYKGLKELTIHQSGVVTRLHSIAALPPLPDLECLVLADHLLADLPDDFAARYPKLSTLLLTNNKYYDVAALAPLHKCTALVALELDDNPLVSATPEYRAALFDAIPSLVWVDCKNREGDAMSEGINGEEDEEMEEDEEGEESEEEEQKGTAKTKRAGDEGGEQEAKRKK
eukprot:TRINITY_DN8522_c0_g4_i1.p1 TRINITY_DN8522_c0_g4~~TRINITY_DN8522_c0_g4_i1.p1  ORF type:complete len:215 (+),score=95.28 TRINITY_DN8522_c0_g4_i1:1255-1899(+)